MNPLIYAILAIVAVGAAGFALVPSLLGSNRADKRIKALQALYIFASVRSMVPRPEAILAHEEALFFGMFIIFTAALWLYGDAGRLRSAATAVLPLVILADLVNSRRAAWLVLGGGLIVLAIVASRCLPTRRCGWGRCPG